MEWHAWPGPNRICPPDSQTARIGGNGIEPRTVGETDRQRREGREGEGIG